MKRTLLWTLLLLLLVVLGAVATVLMRAEPSNLPLPDPGLLIHLPDGSRRPLSEVLGMSLAETLAGAAGTPTDLVPAPATGDSTLVPPPPGTAVLEARFSPGQLDAIERALEREGPVFRLAELARQEGRLDEAAALYLSIPEDDPRYGRAQRRLAWDVLAKGKGQPQRAVAHAHAALAAEPLDANSWQDLARVYGATLGLDVDGWD